MATRHEFRDCVLVFRQGDVSDPTELRRGLRAALEDPRMAPDTQLLWDAREAPAQADADKMKGMLAIGPLHEHLSGRMAMLVATELQYARSRMFSVYAEDVGTSVRVFRDEEEALAWLRSGDPPVQP